MRKCGFHVQATSNELRQAIASVQPTTVVSLAHDYSFWRGVQRDHPDIFLIGRRYEEGVDWRDRDPRGWAEQCADLEMPYDAFITYNEPEQIHNELSADLAARHDDWCCEFRRRILELGYQAVALNVPTGHFHRNAIINLFPNICQEFDYIGLHEYSARAMWDQDPKKQRTPEEVPMNEGDLIGYWYCQRYRDWHDGIVQRWPEREGRFKMIVTECGVAYGVINGYGDVGWQTDMSEQQYVNSLRWYFWEMNEDDYCLGGAIFMVGAAEPKWNSFETLPLWRRLLEIPEITENGGNGDMTIKVYDRNGAEKTLDWASQEYGFKYRQADVQPGEKVFRLVEVREKTGPSTHIAAVMDEDGSPLAGARVAFYWPDAPAIDDPSSHDWYTKAQVGTVNENGEVGNGMGGGAYVGRGGCGPHAVWVHHANIPSDLHECIGMIAGTPHDHLDTKFQLMTVEENGNGNGPTPPDDIGEFIAAVKAEVDQDVMRARMDADGSVEFWFFETPQGE